MTTETLIWEEEQSNPPFDADSKYFSGSGLMANSVLKLWTIVSQPCACLKLIKAGMSIFGNHTYLAYRDTVSLVA